MRLKIKRAAQYSNCLIYDIITNSEKNINIKNIYKNRYYNRP